MKRKLRTINVNHETYLWKREHYHLTEFKHSKCVEKVTIYYKEFKNSPLRLLFKEEDNLMLDIDIEKEKWWIGYPDDGVIWLKTDKCLLPYNELYPMEQRQKETIVINLNRPAVIAELINYFSANGWKPQQSSTSFEVQDALTYLQFLKLPQGV